MKSAFALMSVSLVALMDLSACRVYPDNTSDFSFPQSGDIAEGREAFARLGCTQCHTVDGVTLPEFAGTRLMTVTLGGELRFAKTYSNLVTSIINPNHVISDVYLAQLPPEQRKRSAATPMYMNPELRVTELIDIVSFLNSRYSMLPGYTEYYY